MYVKQTHLIPPEIEHKELERGHDICIEFDRQYELATGILADIGAGFSDGLAERERLGHRPVTTSLGSLAETAVSSWKCSGEDRLALRTSA
jgi:hypothetical protein